MAIELQVSSVTALVTSEPRERQIYDGRGDNRTVKGRFTDAEGRPVSTVNAVVVAEPVGLLPDAQVQLPDIQAKGLVPGAVVRVEGSTIIARLTGGDFAAIRAVVTGERVTPLGQWTDWITAQSRPNKPGETRAA